MAKEAQQFFQIILGTPETRERGYGRFYSVTEAKEYAEKHFKREPWRIISFYYTPEYNKLLREGEKLPTEVNLDDVLDL